MPPPSLIIAVPDVAWVLSEHELRSPDYLRAGGIGMEEIDEGDCLQ